MAGVDPQRRSFLLASMALAACRTLPETPTPAPSVTPPDDGGFDAATIAAAERVAGVRYTDAERELLGVVLAAGVRRAAERREDVNDQRRQHPEAMHAVLLSRVKGGFRSTPWSPAPPGW